MGNYVISWGIEQFEVRAASAGALSYNLTRHKVRDLAVNLCAADADQLTHGPLG
jgi:hypothetical protein